MALHLCGSAARGSGASHPRFRRLCSSAGPRFPSFARLFVASSRHHTSFGQASRQPAAPGANFSQVPLIRIGYSESNTVEVAMDEMSRSAFSSERERGERASFFVLSAARGVTRPSEGPASSSSSATGRRWQRRSVSRVRFCAATRTQYGLTANP